MSDHDACMKEKAYLEAKLADSKASALNFQKQLAIKSATADFALKAGENAARRADLEIAKLNEIINNLSNRIILVSENIPEPHKGQLLSVLPMRVK